VVLCGSVSQLKVVLCRRVSQLKVVLCRRVSQLAVVFGRRVGPKRWFRFYRVAVFSAEGGAGGAEVVLGWSCRVPGLLAPGVNTFLASG